jgi:hypothetical protein
MRADLYEHFLSLRNQGIKQTTIINEAISDLLKKYDLT